MIRTSFQTLAAILLFGELAYAQATQPAAAQTDVPVRQVVLFSSGVGYFEHFGNVQGDGSTELRFKTTQINDILKSLVLQDLDGGRVNTITYPSQDPIAKTLRSFQIDITGNPSMADLLNQLRGAKVSITSQAEKLSGTVLGVELKRKPVERGEPVQIPVLNLMSGATIRSIELDSVSSLVLEDAQLQEELSKALAALTQARDQDKKPVSIAFAGQGNRRVRIGYVVETPVWKTSYRLLMNDQGGQLQGWAIVENQTESDWNNVALSLVSGRPISFVMDLYQPLYVTRPTVVPELFASLRPQVYEGGIAQRDAVQNFSASAQLGARGIAGNAARGGRGGGGLAAPMAATPAQGQSQAMQEMEKADYAASVQSIATAAQAGDLFQYTVGNVTLARQKSAMLPIITDKIETERLSIYNASVLQKNPLNGVRLKNTTSNHLLQGPVTVLDANTYAGDARIDNVPPGQERLLSYGIDLEVLVDSSKNAQNDAIISGKIVKGVLEVSRRLLASREYLADNKSDKNKTIIIEHPFRFGWRLVDTDKPIETTQSIYRFKGTVAAKNGSKLTVKEEIVNSEAIAILPTDLSQLAFYSRTGEIPKNVRDALAKAIQLKQALEDTHRQINDRSQQLGEITEEQNRIRENMRTIAQNAPLYSQLLTKLGDQEKQIEKLQQERREFGAKLEVQRKELEDYLTNLNIG